MKAQVTARRLVVAFACVPAILTVAPEEAKGQLLQGSITGNVTDTSNSAVLDARVAAREQKTNFIRETTTNAAEVYNLPTMPPGTYTVTVAATSFQTVTVNGVTVSPEEVTRRDVVLAVNQVNQTLEVQAEAVGLQTDRADIRDDIGSNLLANAPILQSRAGPTTYTERCSKTTPINIFRRIPRQPTAHCPIRNTSITNMAASSADRSRRTSYSTL
jgi:hypothetical protein